MPTARLLGALICGLALPACALRTQHGAAAAPSCTPDSTVLLTGPVGSVYTEHSATTPPDLRTPGPVHYPEKLRDEGIGGTVYLAAVIDTAGRAEPASVHIMCATDSAFARAAADALLRSRYLPGTVAGRPVRVQIVVPIHFQVSSSIGQQPR